MTELTESIADDPTLCVSCVQPFVDAELPFGTPVVCPTCFQKLAFDRLMEWHAARYEADTHIKRFVELIQGFSLELKEAELVHQPTEFPRCDHGVAVVACWKCRLKHTKRGGGGNGSQEGGAVSIDSTEL